MLIRDATDADITQILILVKIAFPKEEISRFVLDILNDPTAKPTLSLVAVVENQIVGHIMFTPAHITNQPAKMSLLSPLAVLQEHQKRGIGSALIKSGLQMLSKNSVELVFVVGHPAYYPRYGFKPAVKLGFESPFPISERVADAWMVQELRFGVIGKVKGKVVCCDAVMKPEYWRE